MKIFITGANSQLAKSFLEIYPKDNVISATKNVLDVTDRDNVLKQIKKNKPDIIFHFASMTRGEDCAKNPKKSYKINVIGTKNVVDAARLNNSALLFISTNEVFDGKKDVPYTENDNPSPITVVGKNKYEAEIIIKKNISNYYIVRTSWLFSKRNKNFLHSVFSKAKNKKKIRLVEDEVSSPTYSVDLCIALKKLIKTKKYGIYHITNAGMASRLEFAKKAFDIYGFEDIGIVPIKLENYTRLSKPPLFTALSSKKVKRLGIILPGWEAALKKFKNSNK